MPPLEEPQQYGGWLNAFFQTWVGALIRPIEFFDSVRRGIRLSEPLIFATIIGWASAVISALLSLAINIPMSWLLSAIGGGGAFGTLFATMSQAAWFFVLVFFGWLFVLAGALIYALIIHFFLFIVNGARNGLVATIRTIGYAYAPNVFTLVPFFGGIVAVIYMLVLEIIGLARAHQIEYWRSAIAVFLPIILVCCCAVGLITCFMAMLAGAAK